jgi:hypothetical protein
MNKNKCTSLLFTLIGLLVSSGCSLLQRSDQSGYSDPQAAARKERQATKSFPRSAANPESRQILKQLENRLSSKKEVEQYSKALPWFKSDSERIDFLRQPDFEARQEWLNRNQFSKRSQLSKIEFQELIQAQDIAIGMPQSLVAQSWGEPQSIEVSGQPEFRNERWRYFRYISTQDGFRPEKRTVYFEGGRVVGWDVE